jgi:hypothetical protein
MDSTSKDLNHSIKCSRCSFIHTICQDIVCTECGNDHSFRGNIAEVITSFDLIPELLYDKMEILGGA